MSARQSSYTLRPQYSSAVSQRKVIKTTPVTFLGATPLEWAGMLFIMLLCGVTHP